MTPTQRADIEAIVNAIGEISKIEALNAIDAIMLGSGTDSSEAKLAVDRAGAPAQKSTSSNSVSPSPEVREGQQEEQNKDLSRSDQPQLRAGEADPRDDDRDGVRR